MGKQLKDGSRNKQVSVSGGDRGMKILLEIRVWDGMVQELRAAGHAWDGQENGKETRAMKKFLRGPRRSV